MAPNVTQPHTLNYYNEHLRYLLHCAKYQGSHFLVMITFFVLTTGKTLYSMLYDNAVPLILSKAYEKGIDHLTDKTEARKS